MGTDLTHGGQQRHREPSAGVGVTGEHGDERGGALVAGEPRHHQRRGVGEDLAQRVGPAADHDHHGGHA